ncbi:Occludin [Dissostichus eleginoides]|uniref:Occludin n=1 Tax=Dissostichus eleginoides TaxID=100907 RepID=A0AAD9CA35_DISEL|nr:Occludin [Dissostichus eleginoides]
MLLVLSHGQASVERRFSINKELIVENQKEASLVAQRLIVGHIRSVGGVTNVQLTKELLISVSGARQRYHSYLDDQKRANAKEKGVQKRKALADELDELKKKRARVQNDIGALEKSADEYADKAESSGKLTFITKQTVCVALPKKRMHLFKTLRRKSMRSLLI